LFDEANMAKTESRAASPLAIAYIPRTLRANWCMISWTCHVDTKWAAETLLSASTVPRTSSARRYVFGEGRAAVLFIVDFLEKNTNVIELYNLILKEVNDNQKTWYNSGIGTYARPSWKSLKFYKQVLDHKIDLAIAWCVEFSLFRAFISRLAHQGF